MSHDIPNTNLQTQMAKHPALLASVGAIRTTLNLQYREHVYAKTLEQLAGESFEPLAGIRVTILPIIDGHVGYASEISSNLILMSHFVEYHTGHRRTLAAVVELVDGYVPVGVDKQAFEDAMRNGFECLFNECGYTLQEDAPDGLRHMRTKRIGHSLLERIFDPISALTGLEIHDPSVVTTTIEDGAILVRAPVEIVLPKPSNNYDFFPSTLAFNRVHRDVLGALANISGKRLWLKIDGSKSEKENRGYLTTEKVLENPHDTITNPDGTLTHRNYPEYNQVWTMGEDLPAEVICLPLNVSGVVSGKTLTVRIPLDLSTPPGGGSIVFENPMEWVELRRHSVRFPKGAYDGVVKKESIDIQVCGESYSPATMHYLPEVKKVAAAAAAAAQEREDAARKREEKERKENYQSSIETPSRYSQEPVTDLEVVDVKPPIRHGFFDRLKAALDAFNNPPR